MVPLTPLLVHAVHPSNVCQKCVVSFVDMGGFLAWQASGDTGHNMLGCIAVEIENLSM